jgi:excisionase family DNA binding protein
MPPGVVDDNEGLEKNLEMGVRPVKRPRLLTTREVAERLALSPETILRRVRAGELPAYRIASNALRFSEEEIEAYLERSAYACRTTTSVSSTRAKEHQ